MASAYLELEQTAPPSRFALALELIQSGRTVSFRGVGFALIEGVLQVSAEVSSAGKPTPDSAKSEIQRAKSVLSALLASREYADALGGRPVRFSVVHDYGMGATEVYEESGYGAA